MAATVAARAGARDSLPRDGQRLPRDRRRTARPTLVRRRRARIEELEARWSRFRPDSELCRLNAAAGRPCSSPPTRSHAVTAAVDAWRATDGRFDPTVLPALVALGYDRDFADARAATPTDPSRAAPAPRTRVRRDRDRRRRSARSRCRRDRHRPRRDRQGPRRRPRRRRAHRRGRRRRVRQRRRRPARRGRRADRRRLGRRRRAPARRPARAGRRRGRDQLVAQAALDARRRRATTTSSTRGAGCPRRAGPHRGARCRRVRRGRRGADEGRVRRRRRTRRRRSSRDAGATGLLVTDAGAVHPARRASRSTCDELAGLVVHRPRRRARVVGPRDRVGRLGAAALRPASPASRSRPGCSTSTGSSARSPWSSSGCTARRSGSTPSCTSGRPSSSCRSPRRGSRARSPGASSRSTCSLAIEVTSLLQRRIPRRLWHAVHLSSFGLFAFATIHALTAGTDAGSRAGPLVRARQHASSIVNLTVLRVVSRRAGRAPARGRAGAPTRSVAARP